MIDCLTTEEMMMFLSLLTTPDVWAVYADGSQIDVGPTVWRWVEYLDRWVHGATPPCVKEMGV